MSRRKLETEESKSQEEEEKASAKGQLAVDAYETDNDIIITAPIAGVNPDEIEVAITDDVVSIEGKRTSPEKVKKEDYFIQECYWGKFSRSYILPVEVDADKGEAKIDNGILKVTIPKTKKSQKRVLPISSS